MTAAALASQRGPYQGHGVIGDVTEALHAYLHQGWPPGRPPPRVVEDLAFEPPDREEVVYVYMYRAARNTALLNPKRFRQASVVLPEAERRGDHLLYAKPPLYLDLFYLVAAHARFRSDAERLLGYTLLRLNEATHLLYRPRRYVLPDGREVDATGQPWSADRRGEGVIMEKVSLAMVDDLTLGEAVHFFHIHEAPFRPHTTWRARCAMEGALVEGPPAVVRARPVESVDSGGSAGGARSSRSSPGSGGRARLGSGRPPTRDPDAPQED